MVTQAEADEKQYSAWRKGETVASKEEGPLWQIAIMVLKICFGFIIYGYVIHKPSRRSDPDAE
jgi:hypothetical protein